MTVFIIYLLGVIFSIFILNYADSLPSDYTIAIKNIIQSVFFSIFSK